MLAEIKIANDSIARIKIDITRDGPKTTYTALISVQENKIVKIKQETRGFINNQCQTAKGEAEESIRSYKVSFDEELEFCRYKLTIYWGSLYTTYIKKEKDINVECLTGEELMRIFTIGNPAEDCQQIESYDIIDLKSILDVTK